MKFPIKDFFSKYDVICRKLRIWLHLLKKSLKQNFIFWAAYRTKPRWGCFKFPINKNCHNPWTINDIDIKLGPVTMFVKRNTATLKKVKLTWCQQIMTSLSLFLIYGCFGATRIPDAWSMILFINSNLLSYKKWKQN